MHSLYFAHSYYNITIEGKDFPLIEFILHSFGEDHYGKLFLKSNLKGVSICHKLYYGKRCTSSIIQLHSYLVNPNTSVPLKKPSDVEAFRLSGHRFHSTL